MHANHTIPLTITHTKNMPFKDYNLTNQSPQSPVTFSEARPLHAPVTFPEARAVSMLGPMANVPLLPESFPVMCSMSATIVQR